MSLRVDPDWWKTLFDEVYLITDARSVCSDEITRREIDAFCDLIPMKPRDRILDLCGGHGRHALELGRRGFRECTVLDYSRVLLEIGAENAARHNFSIRFVQGDARDTKLEGDGYDHVLILGNSLGYITDDEADLQILKECRRVLRPRGWLLLDVTNGQMVSDTITPSAWHEIGEDIVVCRQREIHDDCICAREMVLSKKKGLLRDQTYRIRLYAPQHLAVLVADAGFADVRIHAGCSAFAGNEDVGCMNHRLVISARKP